MIFLRLQWRSLFIIWGAVLFLALGIGVLVYSLGPSNKKPERINYKPREPGTSIDTSGFRDVFENIEPWGSNPSLEDYAAAYENAVPRGLSALDQPAKTGTDRAVMRLLKKASLLNAHGEAAEAYQALAEVESRLRGTYVEEGDTYVVDWGTQPTADLLFSVVYYQGVTALRMGENDNCVRCRGQSACIFPISPAAVHANPTGSRLAIKHFSEYLGQFPNDLEVKWLLNLAHMTLGEYPDGVDPRHRLNLEAFSKSEFNVGQFRDVSHLVGLERMNQSGGGIMEDFDNDGLFDIVVSSWAPNERMGFFRNKGDGTFEDRSQATRLDKQMGGLYCVQADYNNDGRPDIFIPRGSWMPPNLAQRPSLLRNNPDGTFSDVTREAGLTAPFNSTSASWVDYNNDGFIDLFACCQHQTCLLYRNNGDETFEDVTASAGLPEELTAILGSAWLDFDNDRFPDLFVNQAKGYLNKTAEVGIAQLYHNNGNGTFTNVTEKMGIKGPINGFSCWAFDFDNDGWLDIFATTTERTVGDVVRGLMDEPHNLATARLYRNLGGRGFQDVAAEFGLNKVYGPMGSNFGDIDNDGYLDFYLGTGDPGLGTLIPNRLFKNVAGKRFAEITAASRTGHLQKGHSVAFGDWDRNGAVDIFIELGGAVKGDSYHNVLFQNPGRTNNWLSVKLVGEESNRAAIGARITVETGGDNPLRVHRHVSSGSSFGANPLEQHVGLGKADRVARLEVYWPTSDTKQVFHDVPINQSIVVTEFASDYQQRTWKPIVLQE